MYSWFLKHAIVGLLATATLGACRPERLPGEETLVEQELLVNESTTSDSTALAGDQVLGRIGRHDLMLGDFDRRASMLSAVARTMFDTDQRRATLLELMIRAEVMALEAQRLGLVEGQIESHYVDEALLRRWLIEDVLLGRNASDDIAVADVAAHFERNRHVYAPPELRNASILLVSTQQEALDVARGIATDVAAGPESIRDVFARYARRFSLHQPTRDAGGETGRTASADADAVGNAALLGELFASQPDTLTAPIETADGWVLLLVGAIMPPSQHTAESYDWYVRDLLFREQTGEIARRALDLLSAGVETSVDEQVLARLSASRNDGGSTEPFLPRRFAAPSLGEHPSRYVGQQVWNETHAEPAWRQNPNFGFAPAAASEASGAAAPEVQE